MNKRTWLVACVIVLLLLAVTPRSVGMVTAQLPAFTLTRSVIGSGGMGGSSGGYTLASTLGQPVAGSFTSGEFTLTSGFWEQALMEWFENFLPLVLK